MKVIDLADRENSFRVALDSAVEASGDEALRSVKEDIDALRKVLALVPKEPFVFILLAAYESRRYECLTRNLRLELRADEYARFHRYIEVARLYAALSFESDPNVLHEDLKTFAHAFGGVSVDMSRKAGDA